MKRIEKAKQYEPMSPMEYELFDKINELVDAYENLRQEVDYQHKTLLMLAPKQTKDPECKKDNDEICFCKKCIELRNKYIKEPECDHVWSPVCYGLHSYCKKCNTYSEIPLHEKPAKKCESCGRNYSTALCQCLVDAEEEAKERMGYSSKPAKELHPILDADIARNDELAERLFKRIYPNVPLERLKDWRM